MPTMAKTTTTTFDDMPVTGKAIAHLLAAIACGGSGREPSVRSGSATRGYYTARIWVGDRAPHLHHLLVFPVPGDALLVMVPDPVNPRHVFDRLAKVFPSITMPGARRIVEQMGKATPPHNVVTWEAAEKYIVELDAPETLTRRTTTRVFGGTAEDQRVSDEELARRGKAAAEAAKAGKPIPSDTIMARLPAYLGMRMLAESLAGPVKL